MLGDWSLYGGTWVSLHCLHPGSGRQNRGCKSAHRIEPHHTLSFLRTTCDGELNHVTPTDLRKRGSSEGGGRGSIMRAAYDCPGSAGTGEGSGHLGALGGARRGDVSSVGADHGCQSGGVPHARKLWVPPPLLLLRASAAANEQTRIVQQAERVASELRDRHRGAGNSDAATGSRRQR